MPQGAGGGPPGGAPGGSPGRDDSYFTESRKGEVNELRQLLRTFGTERDKQRKREIMKKVIAYMTLGIDVSRLFTEMMLAIETRDLVIKKMVYLFLCNYAETHPDLAQMCTNTLVKDSGNEDPMVRGLALRALCSLRLPQMIEYTSEPCKSISAFSVTCTKYNSFLTSGPDSAQIIAGWPCVREEDGGDGHPENVPPEQGGVRQGCLQRYSLRYATRSRLIGGNQLHLGIE